MNSENDLNKKEREKEILNLFYQIGCRNKGRKSRFVKNVKGQSLSEYFERPDFVNLVQREDNLVLVGLEHFRVDHISIKKGKNRNSLIKELESEISRDEDYFQAIESNDKKEIIFYLNKYWKKYKQNLEKSTYLSFIEDFKYNLEKHLAKVEDYRKNLQKYCQELNISTFELGFLIEIHVEFLDYIIIDDGNIKQKRKNKNNKFIVFDDFVNLLETIDCKRIQYIFLLVGNSDFLGSKHVNVICLKTGNIRTQLIKQNFKIYQYAGDDMLINSSNIKIFLNEKNDTESFLHKEYKDENLYYTSVLKAYSKMEDCIKRKIDFVTTPLQLELFLQNPRLLSRLLSLKKEGDSND